MAAKKNPRGKRPSGRTREPPKKSRPRTPKRVLAAKPTSRKAASPQRKRTPASKSRAAARQKPRVKPASIPNKKRRKALGPKGKKGRPRAPGPWGRKHLAEAMGRVGGGAGAYLYTAEGRAAFEAHARDIKEGLKLIREGNEAWVRMDRTPAKMRSDLRHRDGARSLLVDLERIAGMRGEAFFRMIREHAQMYNVSVRQAFADAREVRGGVFSDRFRRIAKRLADAYEVPVREVYTLWFSP